MSDVFTISGAKVVLADRTLNPGWVTVRDGRFAEVSDARPEAPAGRVLDCADMVLWPGLIDVHVHGARGMIAGQGQNGVIDALSRSLASQGVTRHLVSVPAIGAAELEREISLLSGEMDCCGSGSLPIGLHIEGPFLNPERVGAMPKGNVRKPDMREFESILRIAGPRLKMMTIAPELKGALEVIAAGAQHGIVMAAGHSEASLSEMDAAIQNGLHHITHLFNAMRRFSHRSPGVLEAGLTDSRLTAEVICDGNHVHRLALEILIRCRKLSSIMLVSDSTAFEAPAGIISFLGKIFEVRSGLVRDTQTGALGGSAASLWQCLCNVQDWTGMDLSGLARISSLNPSRLLGLDADLGSIETGKKADFFLCGPDRRISAVFRDGMPIWQD